MTRSFLNMAYQTIDEVQAALRQRQVSVSDLAAASLTTIHDRDQEYGAFLRVRDVVCEEARRADERLATGEPLRLLEGVTVAVKDNMCLTGEPVTAASKILTGYRAVKTATAVQRLQDAGALVVGKTNLDEFAMGASTENSALQTTRNPWNTALVPGGSSGGSAVAVASGETLTAIGSDTGGSIRQPAAFTGVVGLKPTYGRISRFGLLSLASSLDQIGPFARTVADAARLYQVMAGPDERDATAHRQPVADVMTDLQQPITNLRIGIPKEFFGEGIDPEVEQLVRQAADTFRGLGATLHDVSIPHARAALPTYYVIQPAEASSNLARYDGIRYGLSKRDGQGLQGIYTQTRDAGFGAEVKRRIMIGTFVLSAGYSDAFYHQAVRIRKLLAEEIDRVFDQVDVLLTPTSPTIAFPLGARTADPLTMYLADLLTVPANLAGIPALSLPAGFAAHLPVGMQLMAKRWNELDLFRAGAAYQAATDWHQRTPVANA